MDDISRLLQEAKPLYFARKKQKNRIKMTLAMLVCIMVGSFYYAPKSSIGFDDWLFDNTYLAENSSIIEEMGLPVDEFGFLKVS